jgi:hypothetical protein
MSCMRALHTHKLTLAPSPVIFILPLACAQRRHHSEYNAPEMSHLNLPPSSHTAPRSESPGAAQFLSNLTPHQIQHLQLTIPTAHIPTRFSQFLEGPRRTPVPQKFHFDALDAETRKARHVGGRLDDKVEKKVHGRFGSFRSKKSAEKSTEDGERKEFGGSAKSSIDLKEVATEKMREVREVVEWRFYATGICLCLLNLVAALDATALSLALPVSPLFQLPTRF